MSSKKLSGKNLIKIIYEISINSMGSIKEMKMKRMKARKIDISLQ